MAARDEGGRTPRRGRTLADDVYDLIRKDILTGLFLPGVRLSPPILAEKHDVSSTVVREALTRLVADGLVRAQSQQGFAVTSLTAAELQDLGDMRILIDCEALRRSIWAGDLRWKSRVVAAHYILANTPDRIPGEGNIAGEEHQRAHAAFHEALVSGASSPRLISQSKTLYAASELYRRLSRPLTGGKRCNADEHRLIMEAATAGDVELAVARLRAHYQLTIQMLLESRLFDAVMNSRIS